MPPAAGRGGVPAKTGAAGGLDSSCDSRRRAPASRAVCFVTRRWTWTPQVLKILTSLGEKKSAHASAVLTNMAAANATEVLKLCGETLHGKAVEWLKVTSPPAGGGW